MSFWFINALFASEQEREEEEKARERKRAIKARKRRELRLKHLRDLDRERDPSPTGSSQDPNKKTERNATSLAEAALDRGFASGYSAGSYQVLSLKSYVLGEQRSFMIPTVDKPNGGRPRKVVFRLYGRQAGKTDFWRAAKKVSESTHRS